MKIKTDMSSGNFAISLSLELAGESEVNEKVEKLAVAGLKYQAERGGLSKAWLAVGGQANEKGKLSLPKEFKRESVAFSPERAEKIREAITLVFTEYGEVSVTVTEYVAEESANGMKQARDMFGKAKAKGKLSGLADMIEYEGALDDEEGFTAAIHAAVFKR